jgi:hypothetical protein
VRQKHLRAARPTENASETPAGRQADGKFTLPSRFALYLSILRLFLVGVLFLCALPPLVKILYLDHFAGSCGFVYALLRPKSCLVVFRVQ